MSGLPEKRIPILLANRGGAVTFRPAQQTRKNTLWQAAQAAAEAGLVNLTLRADGRAVATLKQERNHD